ncbi:hypothetical protein E2C01_040327 [Portunus trituberculatus]|uniref:Uncharacterized protein n=1 Tax=Portunus trituberculatus TaxID=210409 RepID=A0A5B7FQH8_PORTR|nr:hypothetical protein [Portunus trituberculatus]
MFLLVVVVAGGGGKTREDSYICPPRPTSASMPAPARSPDIRHHLSPVIYLGSFVTADVSFQKRQEVREG